MTTYVGQSKEVLVTCFTSVTLDPVFEMGLFKDSCSDHVMINQAKTVMWSMKHVTFAILLQDFYLI